MRRKILLMWGAMCLSLFLLSACGRQAESSADSSYDRSHAVVTTGEAHLASTDRSTVSQTTATDAKSEKPSRQPTASAAGRTTAAPAKPAASVKQPAAKATTSPAGKATVKKTAAPAKTTAAKTAAPTAKPTGDVRRQVWTLTNAQRAKKGLPALTYRSDLQAAADLRAREIIRSFSHTRPDGSDCFTVLADAGLSYRAAGENIAGRYSDPDAVMTGWMNSDGHRANILSDSYTGIAVGWAEQNGLNYWVQLFIA